MDLKENHGSSTHIGLSQVFFLECQSGLGELASAVSKFELLSRFDYPADDYEAAKVEYEKAVAALNAGKNDSLLTSALLGQIEYLQSIRTPQKITGLNTLTMKIEQGESLPETIEIKVGGKKQSVLVIWDELPAEAMEGSGAWTVHGRIDGAPCLVTVALSVKAKSTAALDALVNDYESIDLSIYTASTSTAFVQALQGAKTVLANENAEQEEIDNAKRTLKSAKYALTLPIYESVSLKNAPENAPNEQTDPPTASEQGNVPKGESKSNSTMWFIIGACVPVVGISVIASILFLKKRKKQ